MAKAPNVKISGVGKAIASVADRLLDPQQIQDRAAAKSNTTKIHREAGTDVVGRVEYLLDRIRDRRIRNAEEIAEKTEPKIQENARPEDVHPDWLDHARERLWNVSDAYMQDVWSDILAGEFNSPGTISKRTLSFVADLEMSEAKLFTTLCRFCITLASGERNPIVIDATNRFYTSVGLDYRSLWDLDSIGLISLAGSDKVVEISGPETYSARYFDIPITLKLPRAGSQIINNSPPVPLYRGDLNIGHAKMTRIGAELERVCDAQPVDGFLEYLAEKWKPFNPVIGRIVEIGGG